MRIIKLMPDYQCFPIWDMTSAAYGDLDPKALPISELLQGRLMSWAQAYDGTLNLKDPSNSGFLTEDAKDAFEAEGVRLANRLREELGPQFVIQVKVRAFVRTKEI